MINMMLSSLQKSVTPSQSGCCDHDKIRCLADMSESVYHIRSVLSNVT